MRPTLEVADIFRRHGDAFRRAHASHLGRVERRVMAAIEACRTVALGGHTEQCGDCGLVRHAYNSCRNRHCPKCQGLARAEWLEARQVSFTWKDYRHKGKTKVMTLAADGFIRRFLLHAVPDGFHRIRHVGLLANGHRTAKLELCRTLRAAPAPEPPPDETYRERHRRLTGHALDVCPDCGGPMRERGPLPRRPPTRGPLWCNSS